MLRLSKVYINILIIFGCWFSCLFQVYNLHTPVCLSQLESPQTLVSQQKQYVCVKVSSSHTNSLISGLTK